VEAPAEPKGGDHARDAAAVGVVMTTCILLGAYLLASANVTTTCLHAHLALRSQAHQAAAQANMPLRVSSLCAHQLTLALSKRRRAGDMLGLGTLTLPSAFARLGWVLALALVALCAAGTLYSGRLFTMLTLKVAQPAGTGCRSRPQPTSSCGDSTLQTPCRHKQIFWE